MQNRPPPGGLAVWLAIFLGAGVAWRVLRYALHFPFWGDEAYICASLAHRDFAGLLEPLEYQQIAAPLWLWLEKTCFVAFGGGEYALRLPGIVLGLAALFAFAAFARRHAAARAAVIAVAIFATTYYLARESAEVKPYPADVAVSTLILLAAGYWMERPADLARAGAAAAVAAIGVWTSYPAVFVAGGASLALVLAALRSGRRGVIAWALYSAVVAGSFAAFYFLFAARQSASVADSWLEDYWRGAFPPLGEPLALLRWLVSIHTGLMFAYPTGAEHGGSTATTILFIAGIVTLLRTGRTRLAALLLAPFALTFAAAALERYPYGKSFRVAAFLAPSICLLAGIGASALLDLLRVPRRRERLAATLAAVLLLFALGGMAADILRPYKREEDQRMRAAMRDVAEMLAPGDQVASINSPYAPSNDPAGPRFDQVLYYYFELYSGRRLRWREGATLPATDWLLAYSSPNPGTAGGPVLARLRENGTVELQREFALGSGKRLAVYRVREPK